MSREQRPSDGSDFSSKQIAFGMEMQSLDKTPFVGGAYRAVRDWWAGSRSPAHVWVDWNHAGRLVSFEEGAMPVTGAGNPEAGRRPRTYNKAMIIGAGQAALHAIREEVGAEGVDAIGYQYRGMSYTAALPYGFGETYADGNDTVVAAALREGKNPAIGMIGVWYEARSELVIPRQEIIRDLMPVDSIAMRYPGVPMV